MATREREGLGLVMMISWKDEVTARGCNEARKRSERQNAQPPRLHSGPALLRRAGPPAVGEHPSVALGTRERLCHIEHPRGGVLDVWQAKDLRKAGFGSVAMIGVTGGISEVWQMKGLEEREG